MTDDGWRHVVTQTPYANEFWLLDKDTGYVEIEERGPDGSVIDIHRSARVDLPQWFTFLEADPAYQITTTGWDLMADLRGGQ